MFLVGATFLALFFPGGREFLRGGCGLIMIILGVIGVGALVLWLIIFGAAQGGQFFEDFKGAALDHWENLLNGDLKWP